MPFIMCRWCEKQYVITTQKEAIAGLKNMKLHEKDCPLRDNVGSNDANEMSN